MQIDSATRLVGVFGAPIRHTASPAMHNAAFAALHLNWQYLAFHVDPERLATALAGARDLGLIGVNLTVPHKLLALDLVDEVDDEARRLGAVNTVHFRQGRMHGHNTDGYGFVKALQEEFNFTLRDKRVLVLGAGGAGRALAIKSAQEGASCVLVANRTAAKTEPIIRDLRRLGVAAEAVGLNARRLKEAIAGVDLLVNATSVGLQTDDLLPVESSFFRPELVVYDTIYRPPQTNLLAIASLAGAKVANGLSMLLHQGARAFEIWTKQKAPVAVMRRALRAAVYDEERA